MSWEEILQNVLADETLLAWAKFGTGSDWIVVCVIAAIVLILGFLAALFLKQQYRSSEELFRSPVIFAGGVSLAAIVLWWGILNYARTPANILGLIHPRATSIRQLSPSEVTLLLESLSSLAFLNILLTFAGFGWLLVWLLLKVKPRVKTLLSKLKNNQSQTPPPETTRSSGGFRLQLIAADRDRPDIAGLRYEEESIEYGEELEVKGNELYINITEEKTETGDAYFTAASELPTAAGTKWVSLQYQPPVLVGRETAPGQDEPHFVSGTHGSERTIEKGGRFWISEMLHFRYLGPLMVMLGFSGLLLLATSVWFAIPAKGQSSAVSSQNVECFKKSTPSAQLSQSGSATTPWQITGAVDIAKLSLVSLSDIKVTLLRPSSSGNEPPTITPTPISAQWRKQPPLLVKYLFDLDRAAVYAPQDNPLLPDIQGGAGQETQFWDDLLSKLVSSFVFNGTATNSDVGVVYATWECNQVTAGYPIYSRKGKRPSEQESFQPSLLEDNLRFVVQNCLYHQEDQNELKDVSQKVYQQDTVPDFLADAIPTPQQKMLIIIRWRNEPLTTESYGVWTNTNNDYSTVLVIDIKRTPVTSQTLPFAGANVIPVRAPSRSYGKYDINSLKNKIVTDSNPARDHLVFSASLPYVLDMKTAENTQVHIEKNNCEPVNLGISFSTNKQPPKSAPLRVRFFVDLAIFFAAVQMSLMWAGLQTKASGEDEYGVSS